MDNNDMFSKGLTNVIIVMLNTIEKEMCSTNCFDCKKTYPTSDGDCLRDICSKLRYQIKMRGRDK